jgi:hypothetical protein
MIFCYYNRYQLHCHSITKNYSNDLDFTRLICCKCLLWHRCVEKRNESIVLKSSISVTLHWYCHITQFQPFFGLDQIYTNVPAKLYKQAHKHACEYSHVGFINCKCLSIYPYVDLAKLLAKYFENGAGWCILITKHMMVNESLHDLLGGKDVIFRFLMI